MFSAVHYLFLFLYTNSENRRVEIFPAPHLTDGDTQGDPPKSNIESLQPLYICSDHRMGQFIISVNSSVAWVHDTE